jgi:hypothetical protein
MSKKNDPDSNDNAGAAPPDETPSTAKQPSIPRDFEQKSKERFQKLSKPEIAFEQYFENDKNEFQRQSALAANPALKYQPTIGKITPCGNGDLEKLLDPAEWQGAYGTFPYPGSTSNPPGQTIPFGSLTSGIVSGGITDGGTNTLPQAHQTWGAAGLDPIVGIPTTAQGSTGAVRIGNAVNLYGCEVLSKTFVVPLARSTITFWYAVVLEDPGHPKSDQPFFWVRVTDASGTIVPGAFDFGGNTDRLVADASNPFFKKQMGTPPGFVPSNDYDKTTQILYKDWSCAQIDLSSQVGKQVTIEFVTGDCGQGGHWGYAYVDNFCGDCKGSPTGDITYNCESSSHCGPGRICFDYELPTAKDPKGNPITGTVVISLGIYQNGILLTTLTSPTITSGLSYCFNITPASIPGINPTLGGFDFVATGTFAIGTTNLGHIKVGSAPDGITPGRNNDYQIACKSCEEINRDQNAYLSKECSAKVNLLPRTSCHCPPGATPDKGDCKCNCVELKLPEIKPCISVSWGDSQCDCIETDDVEILCITVCNCYSNVTFTDLSIGHIQVTDMNGNPVPTLPDGTPSVRFIPSGPICFGDIGPCKGRNNPGCVSRELVLYTRGAIGKDYRLSLEGVCFTVIHHLQVEQCFIVKLCQD